MSGLTVKDCFRMFPDMKLKDMEKLMGTKNFQDTDTISAIAVARYRGRFAQPLSIFYAKNDTERFIPLLNGSRQKQIMDQAGINPTEVQSFGQKQLEENQATLAQDNISMGTSIFDMDAEQRNKTDFT